MGQQHAANLCTQVRLRPGPVPIFTERFVVKLRADQRHAVRRIAMTLGLSESDIVRWFIDAGTRAVEGVPEYDELRGGEYEQDEPAPQ